MLVYPRDPIAQVGRIAQLVEQLTLNQRVAGSSPAAPTNLFNDLDIIPSAFQIVGKHWVSDLISLTFPK